MRVVDRKTFLSLPAGTIYAKGVQWAFDGLAIKGDSIGDIDWAYLQPAWVSSHDSGEATIRLDEMLARGASYRMETDYGRDGYFDQDAVFLVFEADDLRQLRHYIDAAISVTRVTSEDHTDVR